MTNSRRKGAQFERQVATLLRDELGIKFQRDLEQYRASQHGDLIPDDPDFPFVIECKAYASGNGCKQAWKDQAVDAAAKADKSPCVIYKYDRQPIRVAFPLLLLRWLPGWIETDIETFCAICREEMA